MSRVLVSGSIAYDRIMDFPGLFKDHFLADKLHNINVSFTVDNFAENFGGTAANIAYNLSLLGVESHIISTAGSDFERYKIYLDSLGIESGTVRIEPKLLTATAFMVTDKADNQISAFSMAAGGKTYEPLPETKGASCALIGAGCPDDIKKLPAHYKEAGVPYFYDPAQTIPVLTADDLRDGIEGAVAVFGNDYEMNLIVEKTGWSEAQMLEHTKALIITLGGEGSRILTADGEKKVSAVSVSNVVDPTGAGDAYRAGFIAGYIRNLSAETCVKIGSAVGAYAVENYGTQNHRFTLGELGKRYKNAYAESLAL